MSFTKYIILISLLLSVTSTTSAIATPHIARNVHHHRALAARVAAPLPVDVPSVPENYRKRELGRRCKARNSTSSSVAATSTQQPVANVAPTPSTPSTTAAEHTTESKSSTTPEPSTAPPPPPPAKAKPSPTSTTPPPAPQPTSGNSANEPSFMTGTQTGQGTFYATGLGACGITNKDTDFIAAMSLDLFDNYPGYNGVNPNTNPLCNKQVRATYRGKSVTVTITDRCTGCQLTDLDFSPSAFNTIADPSVGRISGMTWVWV